MSSCEGFLKYVPYSMLAGQALVIALFKYFGRSFVLYYFCYGVQHPPKFGPTACVPSEPVSGLVLKSQGSPYQPTKNCTAVPPPPHLGAGIISAGFA